MSQGHTRQCLPCTRCCLYLAIPELNKRSYTFCGHLGPDGCKLNDSAKPDVCKRFLCEWATGNPLLPEEARPDKIDVAFVRKPRKGDKDIIYVDEIYPQALHSRLVAGIILDFAEGNEVVICPVWGKPFVYEDS